MADNKKVQEEDLRKLEDEAYFELCQIIAEAMELQDVDLLNARIASWKNKYKKLLDRPSTNSKSDFKKRIEFLLNQYYSEVTKYILSQLKLKEEKKVENQAKAIRELYTIIRNTNDYDLLKNKVDKWKEKYPISAFLKMYQRRIELYTRDKNLRENAFKQEEAFSDLVDITKIHGTLDELKNALTLWEEKYSINDKYTIDDFLKHQSEIKRYTSDEFLQSIAREEFKPDNIDKTEIDMVEEYNNKSFSNLSLQASAYDALIKITKSPNAINEMFTWVYKNNSIKFNDKYKELILSATYLEYSPTYLNKIPKPQMDMSNAYLSFNEYNNLDNIKRYAIISYFNLLLPPGKSIPNDFFSKHIQTIYAKSEKARFSNVKDETIVVNNITNSGIEISLEHPMQSDENPYLSEVDLDNANEITAVSIDSSFDAPVENIEFKTQTKESLKEPKTKKIENEETLVDPGEIENIDNPKADINLSSTNIIETIVDTTEPEDINNPELIIDLSNTEPKQTIDLIQPQGNTSTSNEFIETLPTNKETSVVSEGSLDYTSIVALSPLFFETIYNYNKQAVLVRHIDSTVTEYIESEKTQEVSCDQPIKTKIDED